MNFGWIYGDTVVSCIQYRLRRFVDQWIVSVKIPTNAQVIAAGSSPETPLWFPGARLNYAENLLRRADDSIACTTIGEAGVSADFSFRKLREMVTEMAAAMRVNGLVVGDRVAGLSI